METFAQVANVIQQSANTKRTKNEKKGVHSWHDYYAGYSEKFVKDVLYNTGELSGRELTIVDPWNGSGTTTFVGQYLGHKSVGVEINPVMVIHARAKDLRISSISDNILKLAQEIIENSNSIVHLPLGFVNRISKWLIEEYYQSIYSLYCSIMTISDPNIPHELKQSITCFYLSALFQVYRRIGSFKKASNPTWVTRKKSGSETAIENIQSLFYQTVLDMIEDVSKVYKTSSQTIGDVQILHSDARRLPLKHEFSDLIVTSPPYCTRIDYAVSTKPELNLLGYLEHSFDLVRRQTMGAPVIVDKTIEPSSVWGDRCLEILRCIEEHPSKASRSYYLPTYLQYFRDAELGLREIQRVLKINGFAVVVVQSSYYKDIEIPLGKLYADMAANLGFSAEVIKRQTVRQHMAHINTGSKKYKSKKTYYEDVVLIHKG